MRRITIIIVISNAKIEKSGIENVERKELFLQLNDAIQKENVQKQC